MWRFKPSKYKNAVPKVPKKGEGWITDISVGSLPSYGNHIKTSASIMAFNIDSAGGGNLGILSLNETGSKSRDLSVLYAHSDFVTDFDFCPFDDEILATGSQDHSVKVWHISENSLKSNVPRNPEVIIQTSNKVEIIKFHPQADCILTSVEDNLIHLWDVNTKKSVFANSSHEGSVQSISWRHSGDILASCGKDKKLRIWDPRDSAKVQVSSSHSNNRDSRVVWLGDTEQLITTGFGSGREREMLLRDIRKLDDPVASHSGDSSLGVYIPLFDPDSNMLFVIAQADTAISFWEALDHAPFLQEATKYMGDVQAKGAALVPKRALEVMDGEVNRVLLLGQNCIVPISFQVPRKSYREFHTDLFPDTFAPEPSLTSSQWLSGEKAKVSKVSLKPGKSLIKTNHFLGSGPKKELLHLLSNETVPTEIPERIPTTVEKHDNSKTSNQQLPLRKPSPPIKPKPVSLECKSAKTSSLPAPTYVESIKKSFNEKANAEIKAPSPSIKRSSRTFGMRVSKFRHLNGNILPKECHITDLPALTRTIPGECDGFHANPLRVAVPVGASGNFMGILELQNAGRAAASADMFGLLTSGTVMDFQWDPFDPNRLAVVCDSGDLQVWHIPEGGLQEKLDTPAAILQAHKEKATIVRFHPCAKDVVATASADLSVCLWDLSRGEERIRIQGHEDQILNFAWSPDGQLIATVCKDQKVRIYDPRVSQHPIQEGLGPKGTRGARVVWVLNGSFLAVTGFSKVSERQIYLYDCQDLSCPVADVGLDVSPATLIPHYDEDSSTLFLSGKGDSIVFAYEVACDAFYPLSHYKCPGPHQALSFLHKNVCNVREVEFARALRLTTSTVEPISFYVPRLRSEFFQDDLFPPTRITWKSTVPSVKWFGGCNIPIQLFDLKPQDMTPLSDAPPPVKTSANNKCTDSPRPMFEGEVVLQSSLAFLQNTKEKEERLVQSMSSQCALQESSLPQEDFEGVDPDEWNEDEKQFTEKHS